MNISRYRFSSLMLSALFLGHFVFASAVAPNIATAKSAISATSSFKSPKGCKNSRALARAFSAVQACAQRFSPTHEFVILLLEKRYRSKASSDAAKEKAVKATVKKYTSDLRKANSNAPGQNLLEFLSSDSLPKANLSGGADFCTLSNAVIVDRRVPKNVGEEFRIWIETRVCARFDGSTNTVQLVELRATERFRANTDGALAIERFKYLTPSVTAGQAYKTLRLY